MAEYNCTALILSGMEGVANATIFMRSSISEFRKEFITVSFYILRWFIPVWIVIGIFGNSVAFGTWIRPKLRSQNSSAIYLAALSLSDLFLLFFYIVFYLNTNFQMGLINHPFICEGFNVFFIFTQYFSVPLVLAFTLERWIAICYPFHRDTLCTPKRACIAVAILGGIVMIFGIIQGFAWTYSAESGVCQFREEWAGQAGTTYLALVELLMSAGLPILTLVFNILVVKEIRRITRSTSTPKAAKESKGSSLEKMDLVEKKENGVNGGPNQKKESSSFMSTTIMLLAVSFYLILTTLPVGVCYTFQFVFTSGNECLTDEYIKKDAKWTRFRVFQNIKEIIEFFSVSHYACNIFIYLATGKAFRDEALHLVTFGKYSVGPEDNYYLPVRRVKPRPLYLASNTTTGGSNTITENFEANGSKSMLS